MGPSDHDPLPPCGALERGSDLWRRQRILHDPLERRPVNRVAVCERPLRGLVPAPAGHRPRSGPAPSPGRRRAPARHAPRSTARSASGADDLAGLLALVPVSGPRVAPRVSSSTDRPTGPRCGPRPGRHRTRPCRHRHWWVGDLLEPADLVEQLAALRHKLPDPGFDLGHAVHRFSPTESASSVSCASLWPPYSNRNAVILGDHPYPVLAVRPAQGDPPHPIAWDHLLQAVIGDVPQPRGEQQVVIHGLIAHRSRPPGGHTTQRGRCGDAATVAKLSSPGRGCRPMSRLR